MVGQPFDRLTTAKIKASKIAEFTLSLDGRTARWYSRLDSGEFTTFHDVRIQILELFHREVPKRELLRQFFTINQEPQETVAQDPVSGSLPPARPGCLRAPHFKYLPRRPTGASADDPRINRLLPTNNRAGDHPCPGHRSETTQHRLFDGAAPKHSTSPRAKPISVGPPMHGLLGLWPFGHIVASSPSLPNLPFPVTHGRAM